MLRDDNVQRRCAVCRAECGEGASTVVTPESLGVCRVVCAGVKLRGEGVKGSWKREWEGVLSGGEGEGMMMVDDGCL